MTTIEKVVEFIKGEGTYMDLDAYDAEDTIICVATRKNGDVGEEEFSEEDWEEAIRLQKVLQEKFGSKIQTDVEPCDEWVHLQISV